jgi:photosystem II stability/assembly factor-like uncharacterized protein
MKLLITLELVLLLFASTFRSHNPPGWYQVQLPVNDLINDIFFLDSLTGWVVTRGHTNNNDTAYILKTTDGGSTWSKQYSKNLNLTVVEFLDKDFGYVGGSSGSGTRKMLKTTNGGDSWQEIISELGGEVEDLDYVNTEMGWYCADNVLFTGGVFRTTNGGSTWQRLTEPGEFSKLFFLNKDTGWVNSNGTSKRLYRTLNGGLNWELQSVFPQQINDIFFVNYENGYVSLPSLFYRSSNGGVSWQSSQVSGEGGIGLSFVNDSTGWSGKDFYVVAKTVNYGVNWFLQTVPSGNSFTVEGVDEQIAYAGRIGLSKTTDGGGLTAIGNSEQILAEQFQLHQNYPNPFNPSTTIEYSLPTSGEVVIIIYDVSGREVRRVDDGSKPAGNHKVELNADGLSSGTYLCKAVFSNGNVSLVKSMRLMLIR